MPAAELLGQRAVPFLVILRMFTWIFVPNVIQYLSGLQHRISSLTQVTWWEDCLYLQASRVPVPWESSCKADAFPKVCQPLTAAHPCDGLSRSTVVSSSKAYDIYWLSTSSNSRFTELQINGIDSHWHSQLLDVLAQKLWVCAYVCI